jgi:hypothetical protein
MLRFVEAKMEFRKLANCQRRGCLDITGYQRRAAEN